MGGQAECIFCRIVSGRAPGYRFYEDEHTVAFLDIFPFTRGHALVVPKRHVDRLTDLGDGEPGVLLGAVSEVCRRMERLTTHYNVGLNQGELAGQIVFHLHFHVIPRYDRSDPFKSPGRHPLDEEEARGVVDVLAPP